MSKISTFLQKAWLGIFASFMFANQALAIAQPTAVPSTFSNFGQSIRTIFSVVILIAAVAFVVLFLVGGIMYLTSSGNEEASGKARKLLIDAIIGLVIVLASWAIGGWIINQLTGGNTTIQSIPEV